MPRDSIFEKLLRIPTRDQYFQDLCSMAEAELAESPDSDSSKMSRTLYFRRRYEDWKKAHDEDFDFRPLILILLRNETVGAQLRTALFRHGVPTLDQIGMTFDLLFQAAYVQYLMRTPKSTAVQPKMSTVSS